MHAALESVGADSGKEALGIGLWGIDYAQRTVTLWGSSDRIHVDASVDLEVDPND